MQRQKKFMHFNGTDMFNKSMKIWPTNIIIQAMRHYSKIVIYHKIKAFVAHKRCELFVSTFLII